MGKHCYENEEVEEVIALLEEDARRFEKEYMNTEIADKYQKAANISDKEIAKPVQFDGANWYRCPNGCEVHKRHFTRDWYCPNCGQRITYERRY